MRIAGQHTRGVRVVRACVRVCEGTWGAQEPECAHALLVRSLWYARSRVCMYALRVLCSTCAKTALPAPCGAGSPCSIQVAQGRSEGSEQKTFFVNHFLFFCWTPRGRRRQGEEALDGADGGRPSMVSRQPGSSLQMPSWMLRGAGTYIKRRYWAKAWRQTGF